MEQFRIPAGQGSLSRTVCSRDKGERWTAQRDDWLDGGCCFRCRSARISFSRFLSIARPARAACAIFCAISSHFPAMITKDTPVCTFLKSPPTPARGQKLAGLDTMVVVTPKSTVESPRSRKPRDLGHPARAFRCSEVCSRVDDRRTSPPQAELGRSTLKSGGYMGCATRRTELNPRSNILDRGSGNGCIVWSIRGPNSASGSERRIPCPRAGI